MALLHILWALVCIFEAVVWLKQGAPNVLRKALGISPGLVGAIGDTWKTGRHILTPSFSGMKMKQVSHHHKIVS